ncbi:MAG: FAD-containing oxidoreductase [Bryobacteraceae bacterium]
MPFDAIIIGTGQAGPSLANRLGRAGMSVAVIERGRFGGTCVNSGCIPTKAMVASAHVARVARRAAEYGVTVSGPVTVDMAAVKARKDRISGRSATGVEQFLREMPNVTVIQGHARFAAPKEIEINGDRIAGERIFINVGGRALAPSIPGLDAVPYLTNSTMMDLDLLPRHLLIVGGSYIGLEFGQMFRRFGSEVTILERGPRLIAREDEDVSLTVREILEHEGVAIHTGADCLRVSPHGTGLAAEAHRGADRFRIEASHLLVAVGRRPNTDDLGLDRAGIATDARGYIVVDDHLRTNVDGIWALGDCNGRGAFTHTSYNDYEIVAENLLDGAGRRITDRIPAYGLFIDPPLGRVGMTEAEVRKSGRPALVGHRPMTRVGRAIEKGETQGFMKVVVDAETKAILGAAILGVGGDEAIHSILDVMYAKRPYTLIKNAMHIHPTVSELIPTVLGELTPLDGAPA